ncbi:uncharacterized protein LOC135836362 isoform X2 [Planococcus citri]|uniref:uncharacterized protein LOC135836362 isoform X2 n=1 Tax=Planococcus citri TaxID=170843 RepID=UPI0031F85FE3
MDVKEKSPPVTTRPKNFLDNFLTCRRVLNIMVFLGFMVNYMLRVNLNFAIVDMVFRPDTSNDTISTTLPTIFDSDNHTRLTRSLSNAELALEDDEEDDDAEDDARKFRKNNFVGTNAAAPKPSTTSQNKPPSTGFQSFNTGSNLNSPGAFQSSSQSNGFQFSGSGSAGNPSGGFKSFSSGSGANPGGGFQSFSSSSGANPGGGFKSLSSSSGGNQGVGFQSFSSSSGGNQGAGFQTSSGGSGTSNLSSGFQSSGNQFSAAASETSQLNGSSKSSNSNPSSPDSSNSQQFNEPIVQQTNLKNELQTPPGTGQSNGGPVSNTSDQKVGLAANSLDDSILGEENSNGSRILFAGGSNKALPEVANAKLEDELQSSGSTAAPQGTKKKKRKRYQKPNVRRFTWSEAQQGYLIGSFFWGYILTELPGGRLAEIIGARKVFGYATLGASVVTLMTPMCAKIHFILILIIRIMLGLFLGPTWPSILPLAGKWIPMDERGKFLSNMMGSTLGAGFTLPICGYIIDTFSWEYVFYITGLLGFIWSVLWFLVVFETPAEHPRITPEERWYIESRLGLKSSKSPNNNHNNEEKQVAQGLIVNPGDESCLSDNEQKSSDECRNYSTFARNGEVNNGNSDGKATSRDKSSTGSIADTNGDTFKKSTSNVTDKSLVAASNNSNSDINTTKKSGHARAPWLHIISSIPVWAFVLTHGASVFGYNTITNQLPTFMDHILNYEIKENGILSSFPYIGKYIAALIGGTVADKLLRSSRFTKNFVRKLLTTIGVFIPGCLMLFQIFVGSDKTFSIFVFTAALTANGVVVGGYLGNSLDIAPSFSGTVFGLGNMFSGLSGAVSALLVGYLTDHNQVYGQWQKVFLIVAITYICGALIFLIFGSTEVQPWNYSSEQQKKKNEMESDLDEETGILQATRKRSSLSSVLRSYGTEDEWDTSSYLSGPDSANKLRKKRHRRTTRPETESESIDSSARKKHLRFDTQSHEISTLKPLMGDQHHDSDTLSVSSDYAERDRPKRRLEEQAVVHIEEVKLRKPRSERDNNEDYLLSIKKRASYKEAIENGSHSDYSYDSENKTRSPSMRQHGERKIKNRSDSNESEQTTSRIKKDTRKRNNQEEQISPSETSNEKKTRKSRHKNRKTREDEEYNTDENENTVDDDDYPVTKSNKREAYSKKLKSPTSQQSTSTESDSDNNTQNGSRKKSRKFHIIDAASSHLRHVSSKLYPKSTKKEEKSLKNDPQSSTSSNQNTSLDLSPTKGDDDTKPERKFNLPLSSEPESTIKHTSSSPS